MPVDVRGKLVSAVEQIADAARP